MMMSDKQTTYPMHVEIKFHITNGSNTGIATYGHGMQKLPTEDQMAKIMAKLHGSLPDGYRFMDRAESTMLYMREERGYRGPNMVVPNIGVWYDPETDKDYSPLGDEPDFDEDED
jgi:hypothetical protein